MASRNIWPDPPSTPTMKSYRTSQRTATLPSGKSVPVGWKAVMCDDGRLLWEVRRIVTSFSADNAQVQQRYITKKVMPKAADFWDQFGNAEACKVRPSRLSIARHGGDDDGSARDESQLDTEAVVLFLVASSDSKVRRGEPQVVAAVALMSLC